MGHRGTSILLAALCLVPTELPAQSLGEWAARQKEISKVRMLANISPETAAVGAVVAAPSKKDPDYFYHWIRDAALVMNTVVTMYETSTGAEKERLHKMMIDYIDMSRRNQTTPNPSGELGLGEPKFYADGSAFYGPWGRPQNDGPALRAVTLSRIAKIWLREGKQSLVREKLYRSEIPAHTVIKADLEFVSHHWRRTCFDLWEEISGHHFYTRMVQRRALVDGAKLALMMGDIPAADWYRQQAREMEPEIEKHWDSSRGFLVATRNRDAGLDYKHSNIDAAIVLGVLHGYAGDGFFSYANEKVLATAEKIEEAFKKIYVINQKGYPGIAIGRYPEDHYTGYGSDGEGNPWVLNTNAFAELYYRAGEERREQGLNRSSRKLVRKADSFLERNRFHAFPDGGLSEQMNRYTGFMQGAPDLTWSHASLLTAVWARP